MIAENDVMTLDEIQRMNIGMRIQEQRIFECVNGDGPRRSEKKTLIWTPWADVRDNTAQTRDQTQERLQEGDLSLELRRCEMADTIRRHLFRHDRAYRVELDGDEYEVKTADFTRNDGGKIRFTASFTA